jgi:hypothetical protein
VFLVLIKPKKKKIGFGKRHQKNFFALKKPNFALWGKIETESFSKKLFQALYKQKLNFSTQSQTCSRSPVQENTLGQ